MNTGLNWYEAEVVKVYLDDRVIIKDVGNRGVKPAVYNRLKRDINKYGVYRTYDYDLARKSQVFLEPIELPIDFKRKLVED